MSMFCLTHYSFVYIECDERALCQAERLHLLAPRLTTPYPTSIISIKPAPSANPLDIFGFVEYTPCGWSELGAERYILHSMVRFEDTAIVMVIWTGF
jgi:hypothetical protein